MKSKNYLGKPDENRGIILFAVVFVIILLAVFAISGLLNYFTETQKVKLEHINKIKVYEVQKYMSLDINARRSLELTERMRDKSKKEL